MSQLPPVHAVAGRLTAAGAPHDLAVAAAREAIAERRAGLASGQAHDGEVQARAEQLLGELQRSRLRPVLNATGVILHTNLGRAPLAAAAREAILSVAGGYCNLELDLAGGARGSRQDHVEGLLQELTGAEAALVVGNGAAAALLAVAALAGGGRQVIVSRGQLVEIGGGFRIPEVVAQSGARLVEIGTTNRTRLEDYRRAVTAGASELGAILRVHQSNFRTVGFVEEVAVEQLCELPAPVIDDVGSGVISDLGLPGLRDEPSVRQSVAAGAAIVCCSGDKLLGGPQAGLLVGRRWAIAAAAAHPLARALRIDKLSLAGLEATLTLYRDPERARREIPALAMLTAPASELEDRARTLSEVIGRERCEIVAAVAKVGGGTLPLLELPGPAVALRTADPDATARRLRQGDPPLLGRIHEHRLLLDPRTLSDVELPAAGRVARSALSPG